MEPPSPSSVSEPTTSALPCEEPRQEPRPTAHTQSRAKKPQGDMHGALLGAGLTLGLTLASRLISGVLRKKNKKTKRSPVPSNGSTPRTPRSPMPAAREVNLRAFGSPTPMDPDTGSPRFMPTQHKPSPQEKTLELEIDGQTGTKSVLPPGQLKQQMQMLQEAQEENARLQAFMKEYMATSDKVKVLEQENNELKGVMTKLETQLNEIKAKTVITNGAELSSFKDAVKDRFTGIGIARSVCSDLDFGIKDNGSVDGSASVIDVGTRKKMGALSQLFAWANQQSAAPPKSAAPSQPPTPRRTRSTQDGIQSSDVVQLLNAFSAGGVQF